ncbi:MAG TPA: hypothetical protein VE890_11150, partial [Thermoguttaceae bacterium]|nr:hypothetical protein [Thermoguttaceae bacterium]
QAGSPREPTYLGFVVERATVDGSEAVEALDWSKTFQFSKRTRVATLAKWAETPKDVVDAKFINESFTYPLGPLLGRTWGREVAHYDQIPLIDASAEETPERATEEGPTDPGGDIFNVAAPTPRAAPAQVEVADPNASDGYRLFRFFDFEVEPGKQYRYRVRLVVSNPNYQVPDRFLVNAASAKPVYVMSEFSAPSDVISVSHDSRVYVVSVKPPLRVKDNPSGTVRAQRFVLATGEIASEEFPVAVGKVMNFYATGATSRQPRAAAGDLGDDREQGAAASAPVDYVTEALAVDLQGGESLYDRSGLTSPGELLVLGRDNRLVWQNEFVDAEAFKASVASGAGSESGSRQDNMFDPSAADQGLNGVFQ